MTVTLTGLPQLYHITSLLSPPPSIQTHGDSGAQDLRTGVYKPYRKPNDIPVFVHALSNHAPSHIKNIPENVNKRLNILSCNEEVFMEAKPMYQEALERSGYSYELKYEKVNIHELNNNDGRWKKSRKRQIFWFNPVLAIVSEITMCS